MKKVGLDDLMGLFAYEKVRPKFRQEIIDYKKKRRLPVGDRISLVFENRRTVIFQIQEMIRAEKITDLDKIKEEIEVYNTLIPDSNELSATLLIEIEDRGKIREDLLKFLGIDETVYLRIGERHKIRAAFEEGHSKEDKISAVQYVRFRLSPEAKDAFVAGQGEILAIIDHPNYQAQEKIREEMRKSLSQDLME
ncbi:MAG: DUF3501 family protein [Candidatus Binatia bacterium]